MSAVSKIDFLKNDYFVAFGLVLVAFLIRIPNLAYPPQPIFDEVHFTNFGIRTLNSETDIDIHPPFIRLVFADIIKASGFSDLNRKIQLGEHFDNFPYVNLRLLTVFIGSLLAGIIYLLAKKIYSDYLLALLPAIFVIFDGTLVSYSRAILYDTYLLFFGFLGVLLLFCSLESEKKYKRILFFLLSGISLGLAASIKWSGLGFLASAIFVLLIKTKIKYLLPMILLAFLTYSSIFLALYGTGDVGRFYEVQKNMFLGHLSVHETHPAQSPPWKWPLAIDTFILWGNGEDDTIRFSPNVFSWSAGFVSFFLATIIFLREKSGKLFFLLASYLVNYLPFFLITRPMFLYHYFPALVFSYLMFPWAFKNISKLLFGQINSKHIYIIALADILCFLIFIPFIY